MAFVTIYSYNPDSHHLRNVFYDSTNPSYISFSDFLVGSGSIPQPPAGTTIGAPYCFGVDKYTYQVKIGPPYATFTLTPNARECGYVPPSCDIRESLFTKTDETSSGANNGTANLFCVSSFNPITYFLGTVSGGVITSNTTGYFTGLVPHPDYYIDAIDTNSCEFQQRFAILPFSGDLTHYKYRLPFKDRDNTTQWELRLFDMRNNYSISEYPKDIVGTGSPVVYKCSDQNEDKTSGIISSNLTINLWYTGEDFTPDEFSLVPEQSWFVQLYKDGLAFFQGWILPDEIADQYMDLPYAITLKATDGLPSLKGNLFGDGSGGQGYGTLQIQQYGLTKWCKLVKQCLDQLGYDYGNIKVISSLQYNGLYDINLWLNIGTWSDIMYDSSGVPLDTYAALELLLSSMKLTIIPYNGSFALVNWNDLYYLPNTVVAGQFQLAIYEFSGDFSNIDATGLSVDQPLLQSVGFEFPIKPINPPQNLSYDKKYNAEIDITFNILALLYENPSFEIGSVQGDLPPGWQKVIEPSTFTPDAYVNFDPLTAVNGGAYDGNWEFRLWRHAGELGGSYVNLIDSMHVDQLNKAVNVNFYWRVSFGTDRDNAVPNFILTFVDSNSSRFYYNTVIVPGPGSSIGWIADVNAFYENPALVRVTNTTEWVQFNLTTGQLPGTGIGSLNFRMAMPGFYYGGLPITYPSDFYIDVDMLNITLSDVAPSISLQTGEKHTMTSVTGLPQAQLKTFNNQLFTYPNNKRVAGNIFYGSEYETAVVANKWNFALKSVDPQDRLASTVARSIARNYGFNMLKFEGQVTAVSLQYYGLFILRYYDGKYLMPFSLEGDLRSNQWTVILIQTSDDDVQDIYSYIPIYQRNSRNNSSG